MNIERITRIINEWDPIDLLSHAPPDEYVVEIKLILKLSRNISDVDKLAEEIQKMFLARFGETVFKKDFQECQCISKKILKAICS